MSRAPTIHQIEEAHARIRPYIRRTPTIPFAPLRENLPYTIWLKCENVQVTGSFKTRGAVNRVLALTDDELSRGIITASGGNHGLGVTYAARLRGITPTVFVPVKADESRRERLRRWGAKVVVQGRDWDDAYTAAVAMSRETGATNIHPFDDPWVIAGQGTAMVELLEDCPEPLDAVIGGIGGGGLMSGIALCSKARSPKTLVIGVEPTGAASMTASLQAGKLVELASVKSIADTLSPRSVGPLTLEIASKFMDRIALVDDSEMMSAINKLWDECNLLVEPSAAAPLAALLTGKAALPAGSRVGLIVSGGNINAEPAIDSYRRLTSA
jgi:threonine dehydratase